MSNYLVQINRLNGDMLVRTLAFNSISAALVEASRYPYAVISWLLSNGSYRVIARRWEREWIRE